MGIQLNVNDPKGEEKVIELCDNEEQMKKMTVLQLKKKIVKELRLSGMFKGSLISHTHTHGC